MVRLYPNREQAQRLDRTLEACRRLYNAAVEQRELAWKGGHAYVDYFAQSRQLPQLRRTMPEFQEASSVLLQTTLLRVDIAYRRFFKGVTAKPRFRRRSKFLSLTYPSHRAGCYEWDGRTMRIAKIGAMRGRGGRGPPWLKQGRAKACTLKKMAGKWHAYVRYEIPDASPAPSTADRLGLDVGLNQFLALSDGTVFENPRAFSKMERRLRRMQRRYTRRPWGSKNKEKARNAVATLYERARNARRDYHHKVSAQIARRASLVAVEDSLAGLYRGMLAKQVYDVGWGQFVRFLEYKLRDRGGRLVRVSKDRTSQECSHCHALVPKSLRVRLHVCGRCGLRMDRDVNAARNLLARALANVPADSGESTPAEIGVSRSPTTPHSSEGPGANH